MLGFILMLSQREGNLNDIRWLYFYNEQFLLLFLFIYALVSQQAKLGLAIASAIALVLVLAYVNGPNTDYGNSVYEVREYLLGVVCLFYAGELLLAQEPARLRIVAPFSALKLRTGGFPVLLTLCSLIIGSSIGLASSSYFKFNANADVIPEAYQHITSSSLDEPATGSVFDVSLNEN